MNVRLNFKTHGLQQVDIIFKSDNLSVLNSLMQQLKQQRTVQDFELILIDDLNSDSIRNLLNQALNKISVLSLELHQLKKAIFLDNPVEVDLNYTLDTGTVSNILL